MVRTQFIRATKEENLAKRYQDLLEIARVVCWCMNRDYLVKTCLDQISRRLSKRARCVLKEKDDFTLHCWVGKYECPIEQAPICRDSIIWNVVKSGNPVNLTDPSETEGYGHTLLEKVKIKTIVPLWYVDNLTQKERKVGPLIVDSGKKGLPISDEDFEYLNGGVDRSGRR